VTATSARPVVFEGRMSHAISHQRRREGRSPAVLEAPRRELIQQRQRSPAAYPASARGRRRLCGLLVSNPSSRTPLVWQCPAARCGGTRSFRARCELTSLRRRRKRLPNHYSSRGRRLPAAGRRPRASISRQRSLLQATFFYKTWGPRKNGVLFPWEFEMPYFPPYPRKND